MFRLVIYLALTFYVHVRWDPASFLPVDGQLFWHYLLRRHSLPSCLHHSVLNQVCTVNALTCHASRHLFYVTDLVVSARVPHRRKFYCFWQGIFAHFAAVLLVSWLFLVLFISINFSLFHKSACSGLYWNALAL